MQPEDLATTSRTYQQHRTSFSSSSRGSRSGSRIGSARFAGHQRTLSGGLFLNGESPSDSFRTNVWNPLASSSEHLGDLVAAVSGVSQSPCFMFFHLCLVMASLLLSRIYPSLCIVIIDSGISLVLVDSEFSYCDDFGEWWELG